MTTNDFGMGFFGRRTFDADTRKQFREEWSKMTDSEKIEFINQRMDALNDEGNDRDGFFGKEGLTIEAIDARCEEWLKKSPEEKEKQMDEWKDKLQRRKNCMENFHKHGHFGFGFFGNEYREKTPTDQ